MHAPMAQAIIMAAAVRRNGFLSGVILDPRNPVQAGFDPQWPDLIFSGGHEMKDNGSDDARRNGKDSAPSPIRENAKGKYQQASQYSDLIRIVAIVSLPSHAKFRALSNCSVVALAQNEEREERHGPKDQRRPEPGPGRSATVERHVIGSRHCGYRDQLKDQPHRHGMLPSHADRNTEQPPDAGAPRKVRPPQLAASIGPSAAN